MKSKMKVNQKLLPMKLHYCFMFAGVAPLLPFLPVYANTNLQISYAGIGLIYTILPFLGLISKMVSGALADWIHAHRQIFLSAVIICAGGFFSIYFVPPMPTKINPDPAHIQFDCSVPSSFLRHYLHKEKCGVADEIDKMKDNQTAFCKLDCLIGPGDFRKLCQYWNVTEPTYSREIEFTTFSRLSALVEDEVEIFFPVSNISFMESEVDYPVCASPIRMNCTAKCDNDDLMSILDAPNYVQYYSYADMIDKYEFWLFLICISIAWCGLAILVVMSDTICFQLLGSESNKYGRQRLFGSVGWGIVVVLTGILIDVSSSDNSQRNYVPAFILSISILSVDLLVATRLKIEAGIKGHSSVNDVAKLMCQPRIFIFVLCCIIVGISTGVLWTYQLILVEQVAFSWDCHFTYMKLLEGLIIGISCFGGELPFFFISGYFIEKLGHVNSMSVVISVFGLRFILYSFVKNPWMFLPIELLNGFTFGIFYSVMTSYASIVAPPGTQATMQGLVGASFEGLGIAIGGFVGGALFSSIPGSSAFMFVGIFNVVFALIHIITHLLLNKFCRTSMLSSGQGYMPPSESLHPVTDEEPEL